jgi:hypothetical protein
MMGGGTEAAGVAGLAVCPLPTSAEFAAKMSENRNKLENPNARKPVQLISRIDLSL